MERRMYANSFCRMLPALMAYLRMNDVEIPIRMAKDINMAMIWLH
jgi:hypothetical protein